MEIKDYKVGTSFEITCSKEKHRVSGKEDGKYYYQNFGIVKEHAYMWGANPENVITVKATIIEEDVMCQKLMVDKNYDNNSIDYFPESVLPLHKETDKNICEALEKVKAFIDKC